MLFSEAKLNFLLINLEDAKLICTFDSWMGNILNFTKLDFKILKFVLTEK